jgi:UDP:flavonoid glycosyltransferase YjiC (YdhE family)
VAELLEDKRYRAAAGRIADQIRALPPVAAAVDVIEAHVAAGAAAGAAAC